MGLGYLSSFSFCKDKLLTSIPQEYKLIHDLFESKGFLNPVTIRDFPLRDKAVDLVVRRRRWINRQTNESFTAPYDEFKAEGVRYSKEFAAFLKEVYGDQTYDLPFA